MPPSDTRTAPASVLFSDDNIFAVNKASGVPVIPGRGSAGTGSLREWAEDTLHARVFVVHRIDRDTSGLVLFCRNAETHRRLCMQFEQRQVDKTYLALVDGAVEGGGTFSGSIRQFGSGRMGVDARGKPSETRFTVAERLGKVTLLSVQPLTGRRHQIRVHCCAGGHPVLGDRLYGENRPVGGAGRLMLHASTIAVDYPAGGRMVFEASVDDEWNAIVNHYRGSGSDER